MPYRSSIYRVIGSSIFGFAISSFFLSLGPLSEAAMRESPTEARDTRIRNYGTKAIDVLSIEDVNKLHRDRIVIVDNVLSEFDLEQARRDVKALIKQKLFKNTEQHDPNIRTDQLYWLNESIVKSSESSSSSSKIQNYSLSGGISFALRLVRGIPAEMISKQSGMSFVDCNLGVPFSNQLSYYHSVGASYTVHRDKGEERGYWLRILQYFTHPGLQEREYTIILYLNDGKWENGRKSTDSTTEGCLRCYINAIPTDDIGSTATSVMDISPDGGRMVIFDSKTILHEVLATDRERIALTCWVGGSHSHFKYLRPYCVPR